jgi:hypothetical protein
VRLSLKAAIIGRADHAELKPYWQPYSRESNLLLQPSEVVTKFRNVSAGDARNQWIKQWAGQVWNADRLPESSILSASPGRTRIVLEMIPLGGRLALGLDA